MSCAVRRFCCRSCDVLLCVITSSPPQYPLLWVDPYQILEEVRLEEVRLEGYKAEEKYLSKTSMCPMLFVLGTRLLGEHNFKLTWLLVISCLYTDENPLQAVVHTRKTSD